MYFVVSDIHGFKTFMVKALKKAGFDSSNPDHKLILCGDAFDRGGEPVATFNFMKKLGDRFIYVKGNHESLLADCVEQLASGVYPDSHHFSNGTVDTVLAFCNMDRYDYEELRCEARKVLYDENGDYAGIEQYPEKFAFIRKKLAPVLSFIQKKSINYFETNKYIFVHGWIPFTCEDLAKPWYLPQFFKYWPNWRTAADRQWEEARWTNGMRAWQMGIREPNKTIVCGHWHSSWGHVNLHLSSQVQEFPDKSDPDLKTAFKPFIDTGIIALDGCTAYSGQVNVLVLED